EDGSALSCGKCLASLARAALPLAAMTPYPLTIQQGMQRFHGHVFLAPGRLYFVCAKQGGAWAAALGTAGGGLIGNAIANAVTGDAGQGADVDEASAAQAIAQNPGSMVIDATKIDQIKHTIWIRGMTYEGKRYGFPKGLTKELRAALGPWAQQHN